MGSHHIGSNILEIHTKSIYFIIKSKKKQAFIDETEIMEQNSTVDVTGEDLIEIKANGVSYFEGDDISQKRNVNIVLAPAFFEQTDYEIVIKSKDKKAVSLWHDNKNIREKIDPVVAGEDDLVSGIINFGNSIGYSDFEVFHDGSLHLIVRIEVFPSKISYKEDYKLMIEDISKEIYSAVVDILQKTYDWIKIGNSEEKSPALFFSIISAVFEKYIKAAKIIIASPHHKLEKIHQVLPAYKARKTDIKSEKWLAEHPGFVKRTKEGIVTKSVLAVQKTVTYDTLENQFAKFMLESSVKMLHDFKKRYCTTKLNYDLDVLEKTDYMISAIRRILSASFFSEVSDYKLNMSMSLVFGMAAGYRELYKYFIMLKKGLAINGDLFKVTMKDTAVLYEYWCFIKLVSILKKQKYCLISDDVIKVNKSGVTVTLLKGASSKVKFLNPKTGEKIILLYNPSERDTPTGAQKPDNVLILQKNGADKPYNYVFDAKYRIEAGTDKYYPDKNPGPKLGDINTMHRYRDSIVCKNENSGRFMFNKEMFGAYVLFPYKDEEKYKNHTFYKSIKNVNIGGLPFLPGSTSLVENLLEELVSDSDESAFERALLPTGILKRLKEVKWEEKDVLIGSFRSVEQFNINFDKRFYYVPAKVFDINKFPVRYVALYQSKKMFENDAGISWYGEVFTVSKVKRKAIPVRLSRDNGEEIYYVFAVKKWEKLSNSIGIKDEGVYEPKFTNLFLLENCTESYELFNIHSEEHYRLLYELKRIFKDTYINSDGKSEPVYKIDGGKSVWAREGCFDIFNENGQRLINPPIKITDFSHHPREYFKIIAEKLYE